VAQARKTPGADLARYYDLDLLDDPGDVEMYLALADAHDGPILELGVGSGRIAVALAAAGHDVTGVDNDAAMLERARAAWKGRPPAAGGGSLTLVEHDLQTLALGGRFGLVILALNGLLLLDGRAAQLSALGVMAAHLAAYGRAVVDVWLPTPDDLALYDGRLVLEWVRRDPDTAEWVAKTTSARHESAAAAARVTTFFDAWADEAPARRSMRADDIRFLSASELVALAIQAGLEVESTAGDYDMSELERDSDRIVLVGRPAAR